MRVVGFHQDDEGDWMAELDCGHGQHVRHDPPWQVRPWVMTDAGRRDHLGMELECPLCRRAGERSENSMICRIWHGWAMPSDADAYERLLRTEIFQGIEARAIPGYRGIELLRRPAADTVEFVTLMWFDSIDAVRAFAGADYEMAVVPAAARALLSRFDPRSAHYEVRQARAMPASADTETSDWETEIRSLEEQARLAFLQADTDTLTGLWADDFTVNSPHERVHQKAQVLSLLAAGRIRHTTYECEIEQVTRNGDVVVVMGRDRVTDPPDGAVTRRRYTNVWQLRDGRWRAITRHAQVATRGEAGS